jgi:predicted amidohydrolase YtcJ
VIADQYLYNARVWTGNPTCPWADSFAIQGNHLIAVGEEVSATERIDLGGRLVLPGLWDAHIHFYHWSLGLSQVDLTGCVSLQELLGRVSDFMVQEPLDNWIQGWGWNETFWENPRLPTRHDLDALTGPDRPCFLYRCDIHAAVVNTRALSLAGMLEPGLTIEGGVIDCDQDGQPTGILRELAINRMRELLPGPSASHLEQALQNGMKRLHRLGVTGICDQRLKDHEDGPRALAAYARLNRRELLQLRVSCNVAAHNLPLLEALGLSVSMGDDRLQLGHVKIFSDGTLGSRTALMLEPFLPGPFDHHENCGIELTPREQIQDELRRAIEIGFPVSIHAIGDRANRVCLDLFEEARLSGVEPPAVNHRLEHVQTLSDQDLHRLAELQVTASLQPGHVLDDMDTAQAYLGQRARLAYRFGGLARSGALLAFGSDAPVSDVNPFYGIHGAVCRQRPERMEQGAWYPEERLSMQQTLEAYTVGAARAAGRDRLTGSLERGKRADLVVLDRDLFELERQGIRGSEVADTRVLLTMFDGEIVHREL